MHSVRTAVLITIITASFLTLLVFPAITSAFSEGSLLPKGLIIENEFKPGYGKPIGNTQQVQNEAIIIHSRKFEGYLAKIALPLYQKDTITTLENGRIRFKMTDNSIISMGPQSIIKLSKTIFDPNKKRRASYVEMAIGKTCFIVKKLVAYKYSEFKIKTPTAILGVRGSEFVVEVTPSATQVTALENTVIEVFSLSYPEVPPTLVTSFKQTIIKKGFLPIKPEDISFEETEQLKEDILIEQDTSKNGEHEEQIESEGEEESSETKRYDKPSDSENASVDQNQREDNHQEISSTPSIDVEADEEPIVYEELVESEPIDLSELPDNLEVETIQDKLDNLIVETNVLETMDDIIEDNRFEGTGSFNGSW